MTENRKELLSEALLESLEDIDVEEYDDEEEPEEELEKDEFNTLVEVVDEAYYPDINAEDYPDVISFWKEVDKHLGDFQDQIADTLGFKNADEMQYYIESIEKCGEYVDPSDWLEYQFLNYYLNDAMETFPEAYEQQDTDFLCCVCGKPIEYCSTDSVMLNNDKWK